MVIIRSNGCTDTSQCLSAVGVGMPATRTAQVRVFPNPSRNQVWVQTDQPWRRATFTLYDAQGRKLWQRRDVSGDKMTLSVAAYPAGLYWLHWQGEHQEGRVAMGRW